MNFKAVQIIQEELIIKCNIENSIREKILTAFPETRFSNKKFVADLGEFYFWYYCFHEENIFSELEQQEKSNSDCDFKGILNLNKQDCREPKCKIIERLELLNIINKHKYQAKIDIEVKTRYFQLGSPHLFGITKGKFHLLVFVALNKDYSCNYIGFLDEENVNTDKQNRITFNTERYNETIWSSGFFSPFKKTNMK